MNKKRKFKNNKKLRVFLLFLSLAFLFWMLIKLSSEYSSVVDVDMKYVDLPIAKLLQEEPLSKVKVTIQSVGFNLLKYKFSNKQATISLKKIRKKNKSLYYYLSSDISNDINKAFTNAKVLSIDPDTIFFSLGKSISKKVKVEPNMSIQYKSGYNLSGNLQIEPEYITVTGPKTQVDSITTLLTENIELDEVFDTINKNINIIIDKNKLKKVRYSTQTISIKGKVEKFTERTIEMPFNVENLPNGYTISTFPKSVKVVFQIGLSDFNKINKNDFKIICDFNKTQNDGLDYLIPELLKKPTIINKVKIAPNKIEFLLKK